MVKPVGRSILTGALGFAWVVIALNGIKMASVSRQVEKVDFSIRIDIGLLMIKVKGKAVLQS